MSDTTPQRYDMTDWVVHFVHRRNPANDPVEIFFEGDREQVFPRCYPPEESRSYEFWDLEEQESTLEPDAYAISVLSRIIYEGHIKSGWSFRGGRATIYGHRSAVCWTEMPLSSLLNYAAARNDGSNVAPYGIAVLKRELFRAGGRPVIYGLSGDFSVSGNDPWPRVLASSCGIGLREQYRYVSYNLGGRGYSDWTHEREWRWCDYDQEFGCPGIPLWLAWEKPLFSTVLLIWSAPIR